MRAAGWRPEARLRAIPICRRATRNDDDIDHQRVEVRCHDCDRMRSRYQLERPIVASEVLDEPCIIAVNISCAPRLNVQLQTAAELGLSRLDHVRWNHGDDAVPDRPHRDAQASPRSTGTPPSRKSGRGSNRICETERVGGEDVSVGGPLLDLIRPDRRLSARRKGILT